MEEVEWLRKQRKSEESKGGFYTQAEGRQSLRGEGNGAASGSTRMDGSRWHVFSA